uniref:VPS9 domain-containing protein n=1 Tax=Echeneis naucrates TaxID=173247 RepID=A0A665WQ97_ECHNA
MAAVEVGRMLRLAEQCLERAKSFIEKNAGPNEASASVSASSSGSPAQTAKPHQTAISPVAIAENTGDKSTSPKKTGHHKVLTDDGSGGLSPFLPPEVFKRLQTVASQDTIKKELTPIEQASRLNQKLKANYEARLARLTPGQAYQKTSLKLSLQRQMMENLIIAKARQDALQRKMEERRLRLQEEANRRFAASGTMTPEEQEQHMLYTNVLEYEQDHDWPKIWKANIKENPDDVTLVPRLVSYLKLTDSVSSGGGSQSFSSGLLLSPSLFDDLHTKYDYEDREESHTQEMLDQENSFEDLEEFLTQLDSASPHGCTDEAGSDSDIWDPSVLNEGNIQELEMRALKEHLKAIVKDIHIAIDQLLSLCLLSFECLNTASSKDLCLASIEEVFFMPLWTALVALFRKVNREREQAFEISMKLYQDASPADVGVPLKLFPPEPDRMQDSYPYESAVQELKLLFKDYCPQRKLECVVRTLRVICACAEDYRCLHEENSAPKTAAIGADDLLPILSFVALRCQLPQLVSECAALEEFIHEGYLIGEEGYCLTSMQSALAYVESLHTGQHPADMFI